MKKRTTIWFPLLLNIINLILADLYVNYVTELRLSNLIRVLHSARFYIVPWTSQSISFFLKIYREHLNGRLYFNMIEIKRTYLM